MGTPGFGTPGLVTPVLGTPGLGIPYLGTPGLGTLGLGTPILEPPGYPWLTSKYSGVVNPIWVPLVPGLGNLGPPLGTLCPQAGYPGCAFQDGYPELGTLSWEP